MFALARIFHGVMIPPIPRARTTDTVLILPQACLLTGLIIQGRVAGVHGFSLRRGTG